MGSTTRRLPLTVRMASRCLSVSLVAHVTLFSLAGDTPHDNEIETFQLEGPTAQLLGAEAASAVSRREGMEGRAAATVAVVSANASPKAKRWATMACVLPIGTTLIIIAVVLRLILLGGLPARCSQVTAPTCTPNPNPDLTLTRTLT